MRHQQWHIIVGAVRDAMSLTEQICLRTVCEMAVENEIAEVSWGQRTKTPSNGCTVDRDCRHSSGPF